MSKWVHSPPKRTGYFEQSQRVMGPTPDLPAQTASHISSAVSPSEVITPSPVTTTRRVLIGQLLVGSCQLVVENGEERLPANNWQLTTGNLLARMFFDVVDG